MKLELVHSITRIRACHISYFYLNIILYYLRLFNYVIFLFLCNLFVIYFDLLVVLVLISYLK
jgi:hypothetical protein